MRQTNSRLFFALWPGQAERNRLEAIARELPVHHGRPGHPFDWHITLVFLGRTEQDQLACVHAVADGIRSNLFRLRIDRVDYWRKPRIVWCGPSAMPEHLGSLVKDLQEGLCECGFKPEARPYSPHITLVRKARPVASFSLHPPLDWEPREFVLVASGSGARPPHYQILKRWKLG